MVKVNDVYEAKKSFRFVFPHLKTTDFGLVDVSRLYSSKAASNRLYILLNVS